MGAYQGNELACNSSGNACLQSPQFTEPLWTDPFLKSGIGACEVNSTEKIIKKLRSGNSPNFPPKVLACIEEALTPPPPSCKKKKRKKRKTNNRKESC